MPRSFQRIRHNKDGMSYEGLMNCRRKRDVVKNGFQWEFKVLKCAFRRVVDFYLFGFVEPWHSDGSSRVLLIDVPVKVCVFAERLRYERSEAGVT